MIAPTNGSLVLADPFLKDPNFLRTVVLLCKHEEEDGSFGFVINKQFHLKLGDLIDDLEGFDLTVYDGGPVQKDTLHFIHQSPELFPDAVEVIDGIYWGGDFEIMKKLLRNYEIDLNTVRFFIGYSGWEKQQLEDEIKEGSWITMPASRKLVFENEPDKIWKNCLLELGGEYKQMINYPLDPQLN